MEISLIQPGRNNLKYLKWSYDSIRKNQGDHEVEICVADDASSDGTWDWCLEMMGKDPNFKAIQNIGPERLGHTILYDRLINEVATKDIAMIYHADMYLCPGALDAIEKHIEPKTIVSLTRIEPPLHPEGPEKILWDGGVEPEEFKEKELLARLDSFTSRDRYTVGIFAPWAFYREDFQEIGGHDPLYAPQSKEDSDIFNRFKLNGVSFVQTWEGFVYHMTCRGSRRNVLDKAKNIYEDSPEWLAQNLRSTRNFIRKWGHFVMHNALMDPIIPPKYNIQIVATNASYEHIGTLEPWCDNLQVDVPQTLVDNYIKQEQPNTKFDLTKRINTGESEFDIVVSLNCSKIKESDLKHIQQLSMILQQNSLEEGQFELDNLTITINQLVEYTDNLINL